MTIVKTLCMLSLLTGGIQAQEKKTISLISDNKVGSQTVEYWFENVLGQPAMWMNITSTYTHGF